MKMPGFFISIKPKEFKWPISQDHQWQKKVKNHSSDFLFIHLSLISFHPTMHML